MNPSFSIVFFSAALFTACGKEPAAAHPTGTHTHADGTVHKDEPAEHAHQHGDRIALGDIKVGDHSISVFQVVAKIEAGKEADFDLDFPAGKPLPGTVRGWIGNESALGSMKVKFEKETDSRMHGHPEAPKPIPAGSKLWVEIESATGTNKASVAFRP